MSGRYITGVGSNGFSIDSDLEPNGVVITDSGEVVDSKELKDGEILIGRSGLAPIVSTITGRANSIIVTNGVGSISLRTPQDVGTGSSTIFSSMSLGTGAVAPTRTLDIKESDGYCLRLLHGSGTAWTDFRTTPEGNLVLAPLALNTITTGKVTPAVNGAYSLGDGSYRWSEVYATNGTINTSDETMKEAITDLDGEKSLALISCIKPVTYRWTDGGKRSHYGMIAQQVRECVEMNGIDSRFFAPWVRTSDGKEGLRYTELLPILWSGVQRLHKDVEDVQFDSIPRYSPNHLPDMFEAKAFDNGKALKVIRGIIPLSYVHGDDTTDQKRLGVSAQDLFYNLKENGLTSKEVSMIKVIEGKMSYDVECFIGLLTAALKESIHECDGLKQSQLDNGIRIRTLENKVNALEKLIMENLVIKE